MVVMNVHERAFPVPAAAAGALLDSLASENDQLWPHGWHRIWFDRPLSVGASGGHGPIRYEIVAYVPGQWIRFAFTCPAGFRGFHEFAVLHAKDGNTVVRHTIAMRLRGLARLSWPVVYRWLHDALLEDCLDRSELTLTDQVRRPARRNGWVRLLQGVMSRKRRADVSKLPSGGRLLANRTQFIDNDRFRHDDRNGRWQWWK